MSKFGAGFVVLRTYWLRNETAFAQDFRGTPEQKVACTSDAFRLCAIYIPDGAKVKLSVESGESHPQCWVPIGVEQRRWFSAASVHMAMMGALAKTTSNFASIPTTEVTHGTTDIDLLRASASDCLPFNLTTRIEWRRWLSCSRWACVALPRIVHRRAARVAPFRR